MKKIIALISCLGLVILLLSSCIPSTYRKNGLDNFSSGDSMLELTHMVPENFISAFPYVYGDYFYRDKHMFLATYYEKFILYMKYDEKTYYSAQAKALNHNRINTVISVPEISIGEYDFYLSGLEQVYENTYSNQTIYMYVVLNQSERIVSFLCLHASYNSDEKKSAEIDNLYAAEGLKGLIDEYFIEWYDFYETNNA